MLCECNKDLHIAITHFTLRFSLLDDCGLMINQSFYCQFSIIDVSNHTSSLLNRETSNKRGEGKKQLSIFALLRFSSGSTFSC